MSLTRAFFTDFDPIFRLVQESPSSYPDTSAQLSIHQRQTHVEATEEPTQYVVRAELPGVQKEHLDIHVGNDGRSLTIEGSVHCTGRNTASNTRTQSAQLGEERSNTCEYRSTFSLTVTLPHAVDGSKADAKLTNGVLTLNVPKRDESGRQRISVM